METLERIVLEHRFFAGLEGKLGTLIAGCARNVRFEAGTYALREGGDGDQLYLIRQGSVALEVTAPGRPPFVFATLHEGDVLGASWLVPPYRWMFDARAIESTRAIALDARCLRDKCEADHDLGYELMKRFLPVLVGRLQATRLQLLDLYGK